MIHTRTDAAWDSWETEYHEVGVNFENDEFVGIYIKAKSKGRGIPETLKFESLKEVEELLTALHAAVASVQKKGLSDGPQE